MNKNYEDLSWVSKNTWDQYDKDDEQGAAGKLNEANVLAAVSLIKKGKVYDLETTRFKGMDIWDGHAGFEILDITLDEFIIRIIKEQINICLLTR